MISFLKLFVSRFPVKRMAQLQRAHGVAPFYNSTNVKNKITISRFFFDKHHSNFVDKTYITSAGAVSQKGIS